MSSKMSALKAWMYAAGPEQQHELARRAGTSRQHLYQLAGGFRQASAELAAKIERGTAELHKESRGVLPRVYRTDLNAACRDCEYAQRCLKGRAVVSEFDYVPDGDSEVPATVDE